MRYIKLYHKTKSCSVLHTHKYIFIYTLHARLSIKCIFANVCVYMWKPSFQLCVSTLHINPVLSFITQQRCRRRRRLSITLGCIICCCYNMLCAQKRPHMNRERFYALASSTLHVRCSHTKMFCVRWHVKKTAAACVHWQACYIR